MLPLAPGLDSIGVLARGVADVVAADAALRGVAATAVAARRFRAVVPDGELVEDCEPEVAAAFRSALSALERAGVEVEHRHLPVLAEAQELMDRHGTLAVAEAHRRYGHLLDHPADVDPLVLRRLRAYAPEGVETVRAARDPLRGRLAADLDGAVLVCPTVRLPAPPVAPLRADLDVMEAVNRRVLRTTMLLSYLDCPGVALPHGALDHGDLLGSVLLSLPQGEDDRLLAVAAAIEPVVCASPAKSGSTG